MNMKKKALQSQLPIFLLADRWRLNSIPEMVALLHE
jgi:hypothetical protein